MKTRKARRIILSALGLILGLAILLVTSLFLFPHQWINNIIGSKGSGATGRELAVDGDITFDWDWKTPSVHIEKIRMSNTPGATDPQMVEIEALDFKIRIWKLLIGRLDLPQLKLTAPKIILEKDADGNKNWELPTFSKSNAAASAALPTKRSNFPLIGEMEITDGTLIYRDETKSLDVTLNIDTITGNPGGKDIFELSGDGTLQDKPFTIEASGGSLNDLRDSSKKYPLHLDLSMGLTKIKIDGTFQDPIKMQGVDAVLDLQGDNLADLFYLTAIPLPPSPPYTLKGELKKEGEVWTFNNFQGKVGDSDLAGNLQYDVSGERGFMTAQLVSDLLDIDDIGGFIGVAPSTKKGETASPEQKKQAQEQARSDKVLPDMKLDLGRLRATDLDVTLDVKKINAPGIPLENMNVRFNLLDGVLKLDPMQLGVAQGVVDGSLTLNGQKDIPSVTMNLNLRKLSLRQFFSGSQFESFSAGRFGGRIQLAGNGRSLAEVLGDSDGHITLSMAGGKISLLIIEGAGIDLAELTPLLLGDDKNTDIRCIVGDFDVKDGLLTSNAFVFDTSDTNIQGDAKINLKSEALDIQVEAHPKDSSILSLRTPLTVGGTMKKPALGINPTDLAAKSAGAAVLGVLLTPFASIIPFIELGLGEDSDCRDLISQARANATKEEKKLEQKKE